MGWGQSWLIWAMFRACLTLSLASPFIFHTYSKCWAFLTNKLSTFQMTSVLKYEWKSESSIMEIVLQVAYVITTVWLLAWDRYAVQKENDFIWVGSGDWGEKTYGLGEVVCLSNKQLQNNLETNERLMLFQSYYNSVQWEWCSPSCVLLLKVKDFSLNIWDMTHTQRIECHVFLWQPSPHPFHKMQLKRLWTAVQHSY